MLLHFPHNKASALAITIVLFTWNYFTPLKQLKIFTAAAAVLQKVTFAFQHDGPNTTVGGS